MPNLVATCLEGYIAAHALPSQNLTILVTTGSKADVTSSFQCLEGILVAQGHYGVSCTSSGVSSTSSLEVSSKIACADALEESDKLSFSLVPLPFWVKTLCESQ